jgi:type IV secretory pathway VirB2 component (pilin)
MTGHNPNNLHTRPNRITLFLVTLLTLLAVPAVASANPLDKLVSSLKGYIDTFTNVIIPVLCVAALAWCGFCIATDRKTYTDLIKVLVGCAIAVGASQIIAYVTQGL